MGMKTNYKDVEHYSKEIYFKSNYKYKVDSYIEIVLSTEK